MLVYKGELFMSSVTISEVIILIAATLLAGSFTAYAIFYGNLIQNNVASSMDAVRHQMNTRVKIVYATMNESENCFIVYVKNVGSLPILRSYFTYIDLYVGPYKRASLYTYSSSSTSVGHFQVLDADRDGVWEVGETAIFKAFHNGVFSRDEPLYEAKIYLREGIGDSYLFTPF